MRIGVVTESFGHPSSEADVDQKVREARSASLPSVQA